MTTLNLLKVCFDMSIQHVELQAFKAAILQGLQTQSLPSEHYPLLQFKTRHSHGRLEPMLMVLGQKIAALQQLINGETRFIRFGQRTEALDISYFKPLTFEMRTDQGFHTYNLFKYHAFNQENYRTFRGLSDSKAQLAFLEQLLREHLETFVKGVGWMPDPPIIVKNIQLKQQDILQCPEYKPHCFDLRFRTNLWIPEHIGLGRRVSLGFGTLRLPRKKKRAGGLISDIIEK